MAQSRFRAAYRAGTTFLTRTRLRLALMTSPHEVRGLLMMYAGLRIGEACAVTMQSVSRRPAYAWTSRSSQLHRTGHPTITRIGPVKTSEATFIIPHWLTGLTLTLQRDGEAGLCP